MMTLGIVIAAACIIGGLIGIANWIDRRQDHSEIVETEVWGDGAWRPVGRDDLP